MVDRSVRFSTGEVQDVRNRNRGLKILILVLLVLVILGGVAAALYFFVFMDNGVQLEFTPMPDGNSLISYERLNASTGDALAAKIDVFLEDYEKPPSGEKTLCTESYIKPAAEKNIPCAIDVSSLNECSSRNGRFGYTDGRGTPCVILKMNKIIEWEPEPYTIVDEAGEEEAVKRGMPGNLVQHVKSLSQSTSELNRRRANTTWITCDGASAADKEIIGQRGYYYPGFNNISSLFGGIPNMNFPYLEQEAYLSPFMFVKFLNPRPGGVIRVKCQAWAKNIDAEAGEGSIEFELLID